MLKRLACVLPFALLAACGNLSSSGGPPLASAGGSVDPSRPIGQPNETSTNTTGTSAGTTRNPTGAVESIPANRPKELEYADVKVNSKTGEGARFLTHYLLSSEWLFWKKVENSDGTVTWTFARPKQAGVDVVKLRELNNP